MSLSDYSRMSGGCLDDMLRQVVPGSPLPAIHVAVNGTSPCAHVRYVTYS